MNVGRLLVWVVLVSGAAMTIPACSGSDSSQPVGGDDAGTEAAPAPAVDAAPGGGDDAPVTTGECSADPDCASKLPTTTPPDCAEAKCDTLQRKCHLVARDSDADGHRAKACSTATATIETGDDCDDHDPTTYPGAWDGPPTDFDSGPSAEPDRCETKDNDCNGSPDDGKLSVEGGTKTCKCDPGRPLACYEYPNGAPIDPATLGPNNMPMGACKKGSRTCPAGIPGTCVGAVGPQAEQCDDADHDCNGKSGNQGDLVPSAPIWYRDADNDNYGDMSAPPRQQCKAPDATWKQSIPNTDCNDADAAISPGHVEVCDGKDNNCNGAVDENVKTHYCQDADADSYCTTACVDQCSAPAGGYIPAIQCLAGTDCNDGNAGIYPGHTELCNGIDDNCNGAVDEGYNLGAACIAGSAGVCKRNGTVQCASSSTTTCVPGAGTAAPGDHASASSDPYVYKGSDSTSYSAAWDWNCNGSIELRPSGLVNYNFATGSAASYLCQANYQAACQAMGSSQSTCLPVVYPCGENCGGLFCTKNQACGQTFTVAQCLWNLNGNGTCDTYDSATGQSPLYCQ